MSAPPHGVPPATISFGPTPGQGSTTPGPGIPAHGVRPVSRHATAAPSRAAGFPGWLREIDGTLAVASQFVVVGNIRDKHLVPGGPRGEQQLRTLDALLQCLTLSDYTAMIVFDPVDRLRILPDGEAAHAAALAALEVQSLPRDVSLARLAELMTAAVTDRRHRIAVVVDYAARTIGDPGRLSDDERAFFAAMEKLSHVAEPHFHPGARSVVLYNSVFWMVGAESELPSSLVAGNEVVRTVAVPRPDLGQRLRMARLLITMLPDAAAVPRDTQEQAAVTFAEQSTGMSLRSMEEIGRLAVDRQIGLADIEDAVRCYRVGMLENPWKDVAVRRRIRDGMGLLTERVRGQEAAARKCHDILIRSTLGLTAAHASSHAAKPRGILFFAGPTGVGKTELAKAVTKLVFGDERAYTRFDMSEFSSEHTDARLIGAPPGYTGHDSGGELTNAVRTKPFSLILFDEIEKAHPRILDKFLQILDDGRLTDGSGGTVHFSETIIVFTSNLGVSVEENGSRRMLVGADTPREELITSIKAAIGAHFTNQLNRPELLNRIGDNIVVFDFIQPAIGRRLCDDLIDRVRRRVHKELGVTVDIDPHVMESLRRIATEDIATGGGRSIGSRLETALVDPLARALFAEQDRMRPHVRVAALHAGETEWWVELA